MADEPEWKRRKWFANPEKLPPWSWLYMFPDTFRSGYRLPHCSWCGTQTLRIGPEGITGVRKCSVCDAPSRRLSGPMWKDWRTATGEE